jgi:hypothetical protein
MPKAALNINQIAIDNEFYVWGSGQDIRRFNGSTWEYYNSTNSAVPTGSPYWLDTRCLSIDHEENLWCGAAQGITAGYNDVSVFYINTNQLNEGESWKFSDLGNFDLPQEISLIYACPFGDDILAFSSPLNGTGATASSGSYSRIKGSTGGRLFYYYKEIDQWQEKVEGYVWPHIYSMTTKGVDGNNYLYYVGTKEGLYVFPQGTLSTVTLNNGTKIIKQATVYNTHTSGIISDVVYALDFDENGNLWIGTDLGLSYFDGNSFWNYGTTGPVTLVKSRKNGHVFYARGDGELNQGTGIWHFNGSTYTQYTVSNSSIASNDILGIELIEHNMQQESIKVLENSFWLLGYNTLSSFDYDIPHVYASSNYAGATGWNFVYYSPTGGASPAPLPKVNKYTWTYPEWRVYQDEFLAEKHPGLDPRNLFLTTKLQDIADGTAGKQAYWDNPPIPSYEQKVLEEKIQSPKWVNPIQPIRNIANTDFVVTSSETLTINGSTRLYVGGYITKNNSVNLGSYNDGTPLILTGTNGFSAVGVTGYQGALNTGFIVSYDDSGCVESYTIFRGIDTAVNSITASPDGNSIVVSGFYNIMIECGEYVYPGLAYTGYGPTGAPLGITNSNVTGVTSGAYPWIYSATGGTGSNYLSVASGGSVSTLRYTYSTLFNPPSGGCVFRGITGASATTFNEITTIRLSQTDSLSVNAYPYLSNLPFRYALTIGTVASPSLYGYYSIVSGSFTNYFSFEVSFQSGSGGSTLISSVSTTMVFTIYSYSNNVFPLIPKFSNFIQDTLSSNEYAPGLFVAELEKDLGDITTFSGITGGYQESIRKSYRVLNFRTFPSTQATNDEYLICKSKCDVTDYSINLAFYWTFVGGGKISMLKNKWGRSSDSYESPEFLDDPNGYTFLSYINLNRSNFSIKSAICSASNDSGAYLGISISSLQDGNSSLITGSVAGFGFSFNFGGISFTVLADNSNLPFYIILDSNGAGVTGGIIENSDTFGGYYDTFSIASSRNASSYYITTAFGGSGSYFGVPFETGSTGASLLTAEITDQASLKNFFYSNLNEIGATGISNDFRDLRYVKILPNGQYFIFYYDNSAPNYRILKTDTKGRVLDFNTFGNRVFSSDSIAFSKNSDFYMSSGMGTTGPVGGLIPASSPRAFVLRSEQYKPELGINLGNIISRPGSGAWTWCDVHSSDSHLEIPLMSTVIFNNYSSNIYGKKNNKWSLLDSVTGEDLLTVKETPYFIYTFTKSGYYEIYNQVEDSYGNIYETSLPGFINVTDHKDKRPDDTKPEFVDSTDYGYPEPSFIGRDYDAKKLLKDLMIQEAEIMETNKTPFGSDVVIPDNPDATFSTDEL